MSHMGWLRLVGSLKLYVSFAEYRLFYRALLQKRPIILRSLLVEATPYVTYKGDRLTQSYEASHCDMHLSAGHVYVYMNHVTYTGDVSTQSY